MANYESDTYELVDNIDALSALREEWDALCARAKGHYLSQTFAWARSSWETRAAPRGRRLLCLIARRGERVGLIWPFVIYRDMLWSVAHPLGPEASEYTAVLVEDGPDADQRVEAAWAALRAACGSDVILLPRVRSDSPLGRVMARARGPVVRRTFPVFGLSFEGASDWEAYYRGLRREHRRTLKRKEQLKRQLAKLGDLRFELVTDSTEGERLLDWILTRKRWWLQQGNLSNRWLFSPTYRAFLSATIADFGPSGQRGIFVLRLNDRVVAAELSSVDNTRVEAFTGAYDLEFRKYSPGRILEEACVRWAFERGLDYDMRFGEDRYKRLWNPRRARATSYTWANSPWGRTYQLGSLAKLLAVNHVPAIRRVRTWGDNSWRYAT